MDATLGYLEGATTFFVFVLSLEAAFPLHFFSGFTGDLDRDSEIPKVDLG
jgi:hypothetical protein